MSIFKSGYDKYFLSVVVAFFCEQAWLRKVWILKKFFAH